MDMFLWWLDLRFCICDDEETEKKKKTPGREKMVDEINSESSIFTAMLYRGN
tara:strand:+ start:330 stop:485 length:156 start_codon:yes stop_codon:yes gene_type:complete